MGLFQTLKKVMFDPVKFYKQLSHKEKYAEATKYFLKIQAIVTALFFVGIVLIQLALQAFNGVVNGSVGDNFTFIMIKLIIFYPLTMLFSWGMLYVAAGISHLFVLMFGGKKGYVETFKVTAYSISPDIFGVVPLVNYLAIIYNLALQVMGIKERQKLSWGSSIAVVLIPVIIGTAIGIILYFFIFAALFSSMASGGVLI